MKRFVPLSKLIATFAFSFCALVMHTPGPLVGWVILELILLLISGQLRQNGKAVFCLVIFAVFLGVVQYLGGGSLVSAYVTGLRMLAMTIIFIILLTTTRLQDLTASLVTQLRIPYEYAFMFTAALRFVPDFIAESKHVQEAQSCRGLVSTGNVFKKSIQYMSVVQPLLLKSLGRAETMALSLELRGFGSTEHQFMSNVRLTSRDYILVVVMVAVSVGMVYLRMQGQV